MFRRKKAAVAVERSSRKEPFSDRELRALLKGLTTVIVARGRKSVEIPAGDVRLADLKGPTGNYRAPMVRSGRTLLVGFHREALDSLL